MLYNTTLSKSQIFMCWRLIPERFCTSNQHKAVVDNIVSDMITKISSAKNDLDDTSVSRGQS